MADVFRRQRTKLSPEAIEKMEAIKVKADELLELFNSVSGKGERSERARCQNIGITKLEEAVMWTVKGVTTPQLEDEVEPTKKGY